MAVAILIVESKYFDEEKATAEERDKRTKEKDLQNATHKERGKCKHGESTSTQS